MTPDATAPAFLYASDVSAMDGKLRELGMLAQGMLDIPGLRPSEAKAWTYVRETCNECRGIVAHAQKGGFSGTLTQESLDKIRGTK